jgi:hypothetical protein
MLTEEKKNRIESLPTDEMLFEINRGNRSRFQRDSFAYLKTCYQKRIEENKSLSEPNITPDKTETNTNTIYDSKKISLYKIAEGVIVGILVLFVGWILFHYFGLQLKP